MSKRKINIKNLENQPKEATKGQVDNNKGNMDIWDKSTPYFGIADEPDDVTVNPRINKLINENQKALKYAKEQKALERLNEQLKEEGAKKNKEFINKSKKIASALTKGPEVLTEEEINNLDCVSCAESPIHIKPGLNDVINKWKGGIDEMKQRMDNCDSTKDAIESREFINKHEQDTLKETEESRAYVNRKQDINESVENSRPIIQKINEAKGSVESTTPSWYKQFYGVPNPACTCENHPASKEMVNHPDHYKAGRKYEPIDVIEDWGLGFCDGNALKYISRLGRKDSTKTIEDIDKAIWYLNRLKESFYHKN